MPGTTLVTQTTAPCWLNKYFEIWAFKDFKTHCKSCFGVRKTRFLGFTDVIYAPKYCQKFSNGPYNDLGPRCFWAKNRPKTGIFGQNPGGVLQNSSKLGFLGSKTLKNTQKHSKTLKNTQKHSQYARNSSSNIQGTQGPLQNVKFRKKHKNPSVKGQNVLDGCF